MCHRMWTRALRSGLFYSHDMNASRAAFCFSNTMLYGTWFARINRQRSEDTKSGCIAGNRDILLTFSLSLSGRLWHWLFVLFFILLSIPSRLGWKIGTQDRKEDKMVVRKGRYFLFPNMVGILGYWATGILLGLLAPKGQNTKGHHSALWILLYKNNEKSYDAQKRAISHKRTEQILHLLSIGDYKKTVNLIPSYKLHTNSLDCSNAS